MFLVILYLVISTLAVACNSGEASAKCGSESCETVGSKQICTTCTAGFVPINGICTAYGEASVLAAKCKQTSGTDLTGTEKVCGQCDAANYFLYKGGCYQTTQQPGQTMCTAVSPNGVCKTPADGYFIPPTNDRDNTHQSVIPCGDIEEITVKNNHKYKGVLHCTQCETPKEATDATAVAATCTKCADGYFGDACTVCDEQCATCEGTNNDSKCKSCKDGYFLGAATDAAGKCIKCDNVDDTNWKGVVGCLKCTSSKISGTPATCTECQADRYLKTKAGSTAETCETKETCTGGYFPKDESTGGNKCVQCSSASSGGIADCSKCSLLPSASRSSTVLVTCTKCGSDKYLKSDGSGCVESSGCTPSTEFAKKDSEKGNRCLPCGDATSGVPNCAKCTAPTTTGGKPTCSECGSGYKLEGEACVPAGTNLSTGAIAGISVAAVVVVGGLVGFLCWWFICRGKA